MVGIILLQNKWLWFLIKSCELREHFVGIAEHVGHAMTIRILTDETQKIIYQSNLHSAVKLSKPNLQVDPLKSSLSPICKSRHDDNNGETQMIFVN